jgi:hypothetical protein
VTNTKKSILKIIFWEILWKPLLQNALILPAKTYSHLKYLVKSPTKNAPGAKRGIRPQQRNVELRRGRDQTVVGMTFLDKLQPHQWTRIIYRKPSTTHVLPQVAAKNTEMMMTHLIQGQR